MTVNPLTFACVVSSAKPSQISQKHGQALTSHAGAPDQVTREELLDDEEYADIVDDVTCELETKYGALAAIIIPQPSRVGPAMDPPGVGAVFVQFASLGDAVRAPSGVLALPC